MTLFKEILQWVAKIAALLSQLLSEGSQVSPTAQAHLRASLDHLKNAHTAMTSAQGANQADALKG